MKQTQEHHPVSTPEYRPDVPLWAQQLQWRLDQVQLSLYRIEEALRVHPTQPTTDSGQHPAG